MKRRPLTTIVALAFLSLTLYSCASIGGRSADTYIERGRAYFEQGNFNRAIRAFTRAIRLEPNNALAYNWRGFAFAVMGEYTRAIEDYTRAIQLDPNDAWTHFHRGFAFVEIGEYTRAIEDYTRAIQLNPNSVPAYNNRGFAFAAMGEHIQAIEDFTHAIQLDPNSALAYFNRGNSFTAMGEYARAIDDFTHAVQLDPYSARAYSNRGLVFSATGEYVRAIEDYTRSIQIDPHFADAYFKRGYAFAAMGEYVRAIKDFTQTILLVPNFVNAYINRGTAFSATGEYVRAIEDYTRAIQIYPNSAHAHNGRGLAFSAIGDYTRAIEDYTRAILLGPNDAWIHVNRGNAFVEIGEYTRAIEDYTHAIQIDPNSASAYTNRGIAFRATGEYARAIENFTQAILLGLNYVNAYINRGNAFWSMGEYIRAIEDYTRVIQLDPSNALAYINRGTAFSATGEYVRAIEDYTRAIQIYPNSAHAHNGRGLAFSATGEYVRAIEDYTRAIQIDPNFAHAYVNRGNAFILTGEHTRAIEDHTRAIQIDPNSASAYTNRGIAFRATGEYARAIENFTQAILLGLNYVNAYINRGNAFWSMGEYIRAIEDYTRVIQLDPSNALAYSNRGLAFAAMGEHARAIEDYTRAIELDPNFAFTYNSRGWTFANIGKYTQAIEDFEKAIMLSEANVNINGIFVMALLITNWIYRNHPHLNIKDSPFSTAFANVGRDAIARSIRRAEQVRSRLGVRGSAIMEQVLYFYYMGVDFEAHFGLVEQAFKYSELLRSRGFLEQLGTEAALRLPEITEEERERVRFLINEIENRQRILDAFRQRPSQNPQDEASLVNAGQALTRMEAELTVLDASIGERVPRYAELRNPATATLAQAQEWLPDDTAVLIYVLWDETIDFRPIQGSFTVYFPRPTINSYVLVLTRDGLTPVLLDPHFDYVGSINRLRRNIQRLSRIGMLERDRNDLHYALIRPVLPHIPEGVQNLIIVPDGPLGHLPFDILRADFRSPDLGETFRLSFSPSISVSMMSQRTEAANLPILAFGGAWHHPEGAVETRGTRGYALNPETGARFWWDLPGSADEVQALATLVTAPQGISVFLGADVSEAHIKQLSDEGRLENYAILHFATHGTFNTEDAERSGLVFSEVSGLITTGEDGYLTIPETVLLNLNARMVMLSACETGLGEVRRGDGTVGKVRAFMVAGAEHVGVSLWKIDDDTTTRFITRLYDKVLNGGLSFREAYHQVKNEFRHDPNFSHPFFWAAFALYE